MIELAPGLLVHEDELVFTASRSGGPGGQHVNKTSTRITLRFDVAGSASLSPRQKSLILEGLRSRIRAGGVLQVVSQGSRSQKANKDAAMERLGELLVAAITPAEPRVPTRVPRAAKHRRLDSKRRRSEVKLRRVTRADED